LGQRSTTGSPFAHWPFIHRPSAHGCLSSVVPPTPDPVAAVGGKNITTVKAIGNTLDGSEIHAPHDLENLLAAVNAVAHSRA
jgi:hypothetical protein